MPEKAEGTPRKKEIRKPARIGRAFSIRRARRWDIALVT
nr:MAG TPA: hypothetical protein [Caudoviricetes sp.]DAW23227.1 MAG TPA: hypothetical protein [Caudoviricetes sp.]